MSCSPGSTKDRGGSQACVHNQTEDWTISGPKPNFMGQCRGTDLTLPHQAIPTSSWLDEQGMAMAGSFAEKYSRSPNRLCEEQIFLKNIFFS